MSPLSQLRAALQSMENHEMSSSSLVSDSATKSAALDPSLLQRYKQARNVYLERKIQQALLQTTITSFNGTSFDDTNEQQAQDEAREVQERARKVQEQVQTTAKAVQQQLLDLQTKHSSFVMEKQALEQMVQAMEEENESFIMSTDDDDNETMDDENLAHQKERHLVLQQRKAQLQAQLQAVEQENASIQTSLMKAKGELPKEFTPPMREAIAELQSQNQTVQQNVVKMQEIVVFYQSLTAITQELGGVQVLSVQEGQDGDDGTNDTVQLVLQLLGEHQIQIELAARGSASDSANNKSLRVVRATFLTPTRLQGPTLINDDEDVPQDDDRRRVVLDMGTEFLNDLVRLSEQLPPPQDVRFVVRETKARIAVLQARLDQLVQLRQLEPQVWTQIGSTTTSTSGITCQDHHQDVVCSLDTEQMTIVLRLTPDCPLLDGSVYVDQLVGTGGWDATVVEQIKQHLDEQTFCRPVDVVRATQAEIAHRVQQGQVTLPRTPTLPRGRGQMEE